MNGILRMLWSPISSTLYVAGGMWNRTADWGWHLSLRILATVVVFGAFLLFFYWGFVGF